MVEIACAYFCGMRSSIRRIAACERSRATLLTSSEWVRRVRTESCGSSGKTWVLSCSRRTGVLKTTRLRSFSNSVLSPSAKPDGPARRQLRRRDHSIPIDYSGGKSTHAYSSGGFLAGIHLLVGAREHFGPVFFAIPLDHAD